MSKKSGRDNGISTDEKLMRSAVVCFTKVMVDCDLKRKQAMAVAGKKQGNKGPGGEPASPPGPENG